MRSLSVVGVWVFEFLADHLPSGSYPKTGVMSGLPTIRPEFDNRPLSGSLSALVCSHQLRTPGWIDSESRPIGSHPGSIALECQPPTELASEQREGRIRFADRVEAHLCCSQFSETSFCLRSGHRPNNVPPRLIFHRSQTFVISKARQKIAWQKVMRPL
jgi:hypothetical protein